MELREVSEGVFAWLVEDRGWGWSNAGFVAGGGGLMVDTFMDVARTRQALGLLAERGIEPPARLLNTHHNVDHCWGNRLFRGKEIIAHRRCAELMTADLGPEAIRAMVANAEQAPPGPRTTSWTETRTWTSGGSRPGRSTSGRPIRRAT
jgi:glyoxylase-like metal-dependent hydrolase (beta-lactamase superfamily II)